MRTLLIGLAVLAAAGGPGRADPNPPRRVGPNGGGVWDQWVDQCRVALRFQAKVAAAPKLAYRLDKLHVFRDGVWADFTVTNLSSKRKYMIGDRMTWPGTRFLDPSNREWVAPRLDGCELFGEPDTFVALDSGRPLRFRSLVSSEEKPLTPVGPSTRGGFRRPDRVAYTVAGWGQLYPELTDRRPVSESAWRQGAGTAPVRWADEDAPKWWRSSTRLYGGEE